MGLNKCHDYISFTCISCISLLSCEQHQNAQTSLSLSSRSPTRLQSGWLVVLQESISTYRWFLHYKGNQNTRRKPPMGGPSNRFHIQRMHRNECFNPYSTGCLISSLKFYPKAGPNFSWCFCISPTFHRCAPVYHLHSLHPHYAKQIKLLCLAFQRKTSYFVWGAVATLGEFQEPLFATINRRKLL